MPKDFQQLPRLLVALPPEKGMGLNNMKEIINPTRELVNAIVAGGTAVEERYVRTCHSSTCNHASHDAGYHAAVVADGAVLPPMAKIGGSIHCHPTTVLLDERGELLVEIARARRAVEHASPGSRCSRAGARFHDAACRSYRVAKRALEIFDGGDASAVAASAQAEAEAKAAERKARKAARAAFVASGVAAGLTADEASALYGAGPWCREIGFSQYLALRGLGHVALSQAAHARSHRELRRTGVTSVVEGSHPRVTAWAAYAARAFYGCVLDVAPPMRDYPTHGTNWRLVTA